VELEYPFKEDEIKRIYTLGLSSHCTVNNIRLGCENQVVNFESENKFSFSEINIKQINTLWAKGRLFFLLKYKARWHVE
jgi:hypothetical protein